MRNCVGACFRRNDIITRVPNTKHQKHPGGLGPHTYNIIGDYHNITASCLTIDAFTTMELMLLDFKEHPRGLLTEYRTQAKNHPSQPPGLPRLLPSTTAQVNLDPPSVDLLVVRQVLETPP
jgi:hypothetical protein